jgi:hypothetical protein
MSLASSSQPKDHVPEFMFPSDMVAQLYPWALVPLFIAVYD